MIDIRPLTDPSALGSLLRQIPLQPFLQSWAWGDFQHQYGRPIWRLGAYEAGQLVGAVTLIGHQLLLNQRYLYAPHGPVALRADAAQALSTAARKIGERERMMYVKIDPPQSSFTWPTLPEYEPGTALQPRHTSVIDLKRTDEELLAAMHQKTRYNIRLAEKHQVTIRWSTTDRDHEQYLALQKEMAVRQGIGLHPDRYYQLMFETLRAAGMAELAIAELGDLPLASNLVIWHEQIAVFNHGGSTHRHKEVMAPYLLQWVAMKRARERGMTTYDFRGIAPPDQPNHRLAGVTRFKLGFGGRPIVYPEAQNAILDRPWWLMYRLAKRVRRGVEG